MRGSQGALQVTHPPRCPRQPLHRGLVVNLAGQVHGGGGVLLHHVRRGDHAHHALPVQHGDVVDVVSGHQHQGLERGLTHIHRQGGHRGDLQHWRRAVHSGGQNAVAQVPVGDDAEEVVLLNQQHRRHPLLFHQLCHLAHAGGGG